MIIPEGLWHSLLTTPPLPAPSSQIRWKSSSLSSPTLAFWVRKASSLFFCCSSRSSSSKIFLSASRLALEKWEKKRNLVLIRQLTYCLNMRRLLLDSRILYSDATSVLIEVDNPSVVGAMFKGTGLFLGAMLT